MDIKLGDNLRVHQPEDYTVGWVCALPVELAASRKMLDEVHANCEQHSQDSNVYTLGRIMSHNIVMACLPHASMAAVPAAEVAVQMRISFPALRFGLMVGIGGGVPSPSADIRLGDVVVSKPEKGHGGVVQYDYGKTRPDGFERTGSLNMPPRVLSSVVTKLENNQLTGESDMSLNLSRLNGFTAFDRNSAGRDDLFDASCIHFDGDSCNGCNKGKLLKRPPRAQSPVIHYGTIASGNQVMRDGLVRDQVSAHLGGVLCFEMEAAGLMNSFPCLVIRGISDYADSHKNKSWQGYAAATAAAYTREILFNMPIDDVLTTHTVKKTICFEILSGMVQSAIDKVHSEWFLTVLLPVDQAEHQATIPQLNADDARYWWVFRNLDFMTWDSAESPGLFWLSGLPHRNIDQISSYIIDREKAKHSGSRKAVLYFFCSTFADESSAQLNFTHTLLHQLASSLLITGEATVLIKQFLRSLHQLVFKDQWDALGFQETDTPRQSLAALLGAPSAKHWAALKAALPPSIKHDLIIVIDGVDNVGKATLVFLREVCTFIKSLQYKGFKLKVLITSQGLTEIKDFLAGVPSIVFDDERKQCLATLQFDNTRYAKISGEHRGSFEWIWAHHQYKSWSESDASRLLYLQGKPGSGKSTVTKYLYKNLLNREPAAQSAILARYFYSYREGEVQTSHYSMLQSIVYDIVAQDESFFYHCCQSEFRRQTGLLERFENKSAKWDYNSLQKVLLSLYDYPLLKRYYLVIDAIDESEEDDRREILELLVKLCSLTQHCVVKVFIASRPVPVLERHISKIHNFIRLQDETKLDIFKFAGSFLERFEFVGFLEEARKYIVDHAAGVFLWVRLVGEELIAYDEDGRSKEDVFQFLKSLPTELEEYYRHMLAKMTARRTDMRDAGKMFQFVLFAHRPLAAVELLHALGISDDASETFWPSDEHFERRIPLERRIVSCGGNFLEIKENHGDRMVQVMHQTVREFFLDPRGYVATTSFRMHEAEAHLGIYTTCLRYLLLIATKINNDLFPRIPSWETDHFESYARYLNVRPLAIYAIGHLAYHSAKCQSDPMYKAITMQFLRKVEYTKAAYLFENWVTLCMHKHLMGGRGQQIASQFRDKVLHASVRHNLPTAAELSLAIGADVNTVNNGRTPLSRAARCGHEAVVKRLLSWNDTLVDCKDWNGRTPLLLAAKNGHEPVVRLLLDRQDVNADAKDANGQTPLLLAAKNGHEPVVRLLLNRQDVNADAKDANGQTPLSLAAENGHGSIVGLLASWQGVSPDSRNHGMMTPLFFAAKNNHEGIVRYLLARHDVDPDRVGANGRTPISWAAERGHCAVVRLLLERGVNPDSSDKCGYSPLSWAARNGHTAVTNLLIFWSQPIDADRKDQDGCTPLAWAAKKGHEGVASLLLDQSDVDPESRDKNGTTPLSWSARYDHEEVTSLLLDHNVDPNSTDNTGCTPLFWAAKKGHAKMVKLLLGHKDTKSYLANNEGHTPLSVATRNRYSRVLEVLKYFRGSLRQNKKRKRAEE